MGDHEYLRDLYHVAAPNDHELLDIILAGDVVDIRKEQDQVVLEAGREVQLVWLTLTQPARVQRVELNHVLQTPMTFTGFNRLAGKDHDDPGSWFVQHGLYGALKDDKRVLASMRLYERWPDQPNPWPDHCLLAGRG